MRIVPLVQRGSFAEHPRARRRVEQLRGGHPHADRPGAHHSPGRALLGVHHRRGTHALGRGLQCLSEDPRGATRPRHLHPGDYREAQDTADDPLTLPDLRFQPHPRRGCRRIPALHRLSGGHHRRRGVAEPHRAEGRRRHARRPVDVRQGRLVLRHDARLPQRGPDTQRPRLRHLFRDHRDAARGRLRACARLVRRRAGQGILRPDLHGGTQPPHARPADGLTARDPAAHRDDRHTARTIPDAGGRLQCRFPLRSHLRSDGHRRENTAVVEPAAARGAGPDENRRARPKKK